MRIAVAGGTGLVGRHVVDAVTAAGHEPVVLARSTGVDLTTGEGLDRALDEVGSIVDVSNVVTLGRRPAVRFFEAATRHLIDAGDRAGVGHLVVLSIVGVDRVDLGYYDGKRRQEEVALAGPVPATVLRATQFHEFADQTLARSPGPVALVPRMRCRPVAAVEVGRTLVDLAEGPPQGRATELAGPEEHDLPDLCRRVVRAQGLRRRVLGVRMPGAGGTAMAGGGLLPQGPYDAGRLTFDEWLATATTRG